MKLCVKKLYCGNCKKLVRGNEQKAANSTQVLCFKCSQPLYQLEGAGWKNIRKNVLKKDEA